MVSVNSLKRLKTMKIRVLSAEIGISMHHFRCFCDAIFSLINWHGNLLPFRSAFHILPNYFMDVGIRACLEILKAFCNLQIEKKTNETNEGSAVINSTNRNILVCIFLVFLFGLFLWLCVRHTVVSSLLFCCFFFFSCILFCLNEPIHSTIFTQTKSHSHYRTYDYKEYTCELNPPIFSCLSICFVSSFNFTR